MTMHPNNCPRYGRCSANPCPLDPDWRVRSPYGSPTCIYLLESVKVTAGDAVPADILAACRTMATDGALHGAVRIQLERAGQYPSRVLSGRIRLDAARKGLADRAKILAGAIS